MDDESIKTVGVLEIEPILRRAWLWWSQTCIHIINNVGTHVVGHLSVPDIEAGHD